MKYYHASKSVYTVGEKITSGSGTSSFYLKATVAMDKLKPALAPKRKSALYMADSAEFAAYFLSCEKVAVSDIKVYEVEPVNPHKCVFALTHQIDKELESGAGANDKINEYWNPTLSWKFYEYLTMEFTVMKVLPCPDLNDIILSCRYGDDFDKACGI